jgi:hypothetical protein
MEIRDVYEIGDNVRCGSCEAATTVMDLQHVAGEAGFVLGCEHPNVQCPGCRMLIAARGTHICPVSDDADDHDLLGINPKQEPKAYYIDDSSNSFKNNLLQALRTDVTVAYLVDSPEKQVLAQNIEKLIHRIESREFDPK